MSSRREPRLPRRAQSVADASRPTSLLLLETQPRFSRRKTSRIDSRTTLAATSTATMTSSNICLALEDECGFPATFACATGRLGALGDVLPRADRIVLLPANPEGFPDATARAAVATRSPDETARHGRSRKLRRASRVGTPQLLTAFVQRAAA